MNGKSQVEDLKDTAAETMENFQETSEDIQNRVSAYWDAGRERATECMRSTDRAIRANPYQAIGIALGLGVIAGMLLTRGRRSSEQCED